MATTGAGALGDLVEFEQSAVHRRQRQAEAQIVEELRRIDFDRTSREWRELACELGEYGYGVLVIWGVTGSLYQRAARHGVNGLTKIPEDLRLDKDESHALAAELLIVALEAFRTKSLPVWDPGGGASLATFFVGRCLMELPDVYVTWRAKETEQVAMERDDVVGDDPDERCTDVIVEARVLVDELFKNDPLLHSAFRLQESGYTLVEIVEVLDCPETPITVSGLASRMYRFRERMRRSSND